jgi:acetylglutamate kinase
MSQNLVWLRIARDLGFSEPRLSEAIPFINEFSGKRFVLKLGGSVLEELEEKPDLLKHLIDDIAFLQKVKIQVILVHGGSRQLDKAMKALGIQPEKVNGLRKTTQPVLELANKVFGALSVTIKNEISKHGYESVILDRTTGFVKSEQLQEPAGLGFVGEPKRVEVGLLEALKENCIPIVSSITASINPGEFGFNVNADDVAGAIAEGIKAEKLILMTDRKGVNDKDGNLLSTLTPKQVEKLIEDGVINAGMIPKVRTCLRALESGVNKCHIIDGNEKSVINEILTSEGVGTELVRDKELKSIAV